MFYGWRASTLKQIQVTKAKCDLCGEHCTHRVSVFGRYIHIMWIPIIPIGRKIVGECQNCLKTVKRKEFSMDLDNQLRRVESSIKRPIWHWIGPAILGVFAITMAYSIATHKDDPRKIYLDADEAKMTTQPTMESDSISYQLKSMFDVFVTEEMRPQSFSYYSKVEEDKVLLLLEIPEFKNLDKKVRPELLEIVTQVLDGFAHLEGKDRYLGVKGKYNMMLVKTPTEFENSNLASSDGIYDFYGPDQIE